MLIDERIEELTEGGAKKLLRRAVEEIAGRLSCEMCAMRTVCGRDATDDDCMRQMLVMLAVPRQDETDEDEEAEEPGGGRNDTLQPENHENREIRKTPDAGRQTLGEFST